MFWIHTISVLKFVDIFSNEVKAEPQESTASAKPTPAPPDEDYNPYLSYGSQNDVFIVDEIKPEPESDRINLNLQKSESLSDLENDIEFDDVNDCENSNDEDDFTWQQNEDEDFIYGLNKTQTVRKDLKCLESEPEEEAVQIKTEPDINIKEEPEMEAAEYLEAREEDDEDEDYEEEEYEKPKRQVRKKRNFEEVKKEKKPKRDPATRPFAIKKDPQEIEEAKKRKLTGKKACKFCATLFKTQQEVDRHKCEYLKCKPDHFICRICYKELSRNTFSNHMGRL